MVLHPRDARGCNESAKRSNSFEHWRCYRTDAGDLASRHTKQFFSDSRHDDLFDSTKQEKEKELIFYFHQGHIWARRRRQRQRDFSTNNAPRVRVRVRKGATSGRQRPQYRNGGCRARRPSRVVASTQPTHPPRRCCGASARGWRRRGRHCVPPLSESLSKSTRRRAFLHHFLFVNILGINFGFFRMLDSSWRESTLEFYLLSNPKPKHGFKN